MRQIVLDTETTGLEVNKGHRLIEIGCIELAERRPTGRSFHRYLNPDRAIDEGAKAVTGIEDEFLLDKPRFHEIAGEFIAFVDGAEVIAHNASFDVGFINAELALAGIGGTIQQRVQVIDTLQLAREMWPGQRNGLDALCKRLGVDNSHRELHGALLDAQLLADVYLAMTAGQGDLGFASEASPAGVARRERTLVVIPLRVQRADPDEAASHAARLAAIEKAGKAPSLWTQLGWD
ncbi:DNA polymerase III subunit epsilon [Dokdonella koreensis]|uniref:DNA polymerase III subunit epsilon n=1 Tax=Dokdonella koreensis DS-123 TaxID=1300342 RepID=A0A160DUK1_9GAMM|nr:DNA polymerase III subunit epsilon [Dokdonella koreensis]ANB18145.1 DNA polymerase III, epsilon subunit [Dokdonella koreensis DS-123]